MITFDEIKALVLSGLPDADVEVADMTGTGDHFEITVISPQFAGKTLLEQHRMIFALLEKEMGFERIHAVKLKTRVPK